MNWTKVTQCFLARIGLRSVPTCWQPVRRRTCRPKPKIGKKPQIPVVDDKDDELEEEPNDEVNV
jgi:hypothetical protein